MGSDTEFACEVVKITCVEKHPGADRLELAKFSMLGSGFAAYTVVVGIGEFKPGDLAIYLSVDCEVPHAMAPWLAGKAKLHNGKYRLRAARLRGVYSEGLLIPLSADQAFAYGQQVDKLFGVTYYNPEVNNKNQGPTAPGTATGPKTASKRKRAIEQLVPEYSVESLRKVPWLFRTDEPVIVTEKIHGTNFRFGWVKVGRSYEWMVGSHRTIKSEHRSWFEKLRDWLRRTGKPRGYYPSDLWSEVAVGESLAARCADFKGFVFYGEIYGTMDNDAHTPIQKGFDYNNTVLGVRLFDLYDTESASQLDRWQSYHSLLEAAAKIELPTVPEVWRGPYNLEVIKQLSSGKTIAGLGAHIREGVVVESLIGPRRKGKWVSEEYRLNQKGD